MFYDERGDFQYSGIMSGVNANDVSLSSVPKGEKQIGLMYFNAESYSSYCKEYLEYWEWVEKRNTERFRLNAGHGKDYDSKNMMHTIRLMQVAVEIAREGKLNVRRSNRDQLLAIKSGEFEYDYLVALADELMLEAEKAYDESTLPEVPDRILIERTLVEMRKEFYG
jgi:hypothetical protein